MDVIECIKRRSSVRSFKDAEIPEQEIEEILELANQAPSAGNLQSRAFIIVKAKETKRALAKAALGQHFIAEAPVVIVVCADKRRVSPYGERGRRLYCIQDADASTQNILLTVTAKGLGACWVGAFDEHAVSRVLDLPEHIYPTAIIPIGYPDEEVRHTSRMNIEDLTHYERW